MVKLPDRATARVDSQGRLLIPASIRKGLGLTGGTKVTIWVEDGQLRAQSLDEAVKRAQEIVLRHTKGKMGLVDEFLSERRREAGRD